MTGTDTGRLPSGGAVTAAALDVQAVTHLYERDGERVVALRDVDLQVHAGEAVALLGPSGSGKSTLLALLAGLHPPTAGVVRVAGHDLSALSRAGVRMLRRHTLALLLQDPRRALRPEITAAQQLLLAGSHDPGAALEALGLARVSARRTAALSAGEQQRLALAALLVRDPAVVLADEPTSRLASDDRDRVVQALQALSATGRTVLVVTHDPAVAGAFPRTVTLRDGRLGSQSQHGRQHALVGSDGSVQLPPQALELLPPGSAVQVSVQSGAVTLTPAPGTPSRAGAQDASRPPWP